MTAPTRQFLFVLLATLAAADAVRTSQQSPPPALAVLDSFDGLGHGFFVPQGPGGRPPRNPSDNSLAVGPDHIVQIVNSQLRRESRRCASPAACRNRAASQFDRVHARGWNPALDCPLILWSFAVNAIGKHRVRTWLRTRFAVRAAVTSRPVR